MEISHYRKSITKKLSAHTDTPQLDAELILMHVLRKTRAELYLALTDTISKLDQQECNALIARRLKGEPLAYLLGFQPFWTMDLKVTTDTLIPRPETECLVEWVLYKFSNHEKLSVADLGTGTGAIAIALSQQKKQWKIDATDQSYEALAVAKKNADAYHAKNVSFYQGDWCDALPHKEYDVIISNPPYIAENDVHLKKLTFEPQSALISGKTGLDAIAIITAQTKNYLKPNGYLVIEHGFDQTDAVMQLFESTGFTDVMSHRDLADIPRFVTGKQ